MLKVKKVYAYFLCASTNYTIAMKNRTLRHRSPEASRASPPPEQEEKLPESHGAGTSVGAGTSGLANTDAGTVKWSQERRLRFIDFRLQWDGRINRRDVTEFFKISVPQASADIARYTDLAPENLAYDTSSRTYVATRAFAPRYQTSGAGQYLSQLLALERQILTADQAFLAFRPPVASVPLPNRTVDPQTLSLVVQAIASRAKLQIQYQSITRDEPLDRLISPHAFGYDGLRWHVRAYCHMRGGFRDFVLGRIMAPGALIASEVDPQQDVEWNSTVDLILTPNESLSPMQRKGVEVDYGMTNGMVTLPCRQAMLFYTLRTLNFEPSGAPRKGERQVVIANLEKIRPWLPKPGQA
ncbi:helix-turn-helix transcriptional regulator [Aquabacterium soli]|nr:WYL domain-containing protein [Aquabacterium soli]